LRASFDHFLFECVAERVSEWALGDAQVAAGQA
jgi:hypothetical protein